MLEWKNFPNTFLVYFWGLIRTEWRDLRFIDVLNPKSLFSALGLLESCAIIATTLWFFNYCVIDCQLFILWLLVFMQSNSHGLQDQFRSNYFYQKEVCLIGAMKANNRMFQGGDRLVSPRNSIVMTRRVFSSEDSPQSDNAITQMSKQVHR